VCTVDCHLQVHREDTSPCYDKQPPLLNAMPQSQRNLWYKRRLCKPNKVKVILIIANSSATAGTTEKDAGITRSQAAVPEAKATLCADFLQPPILCSSLVSRNCNTVTSTAR
jgi:hypothetical protein